MQRFDQFERLHAICSLTDDGEFGIISENRYQALSEDGMIVGRVDERKNGTSKLGCNLIEMVAAMAAAYIATVGNILRDQTQRCGVFAQHPIDAQPPNLFFECYNRKLELSLLQRDGNQLVWKWRALLISDKGVEKRQAVLTSGNPYRNAVPPAEHRKTAHSATHRVEDLLGGIDH